MISGLRSRPITVAPSFAKASAHAKPIPAAEPVIMATLPWWEGLLFDPLLNFACSNSQYSIANNSLALRAFHEPKAN